jgi:hypothetical protein
MVHPSGGLLACQQIVFLVSFTGNAESVSGLAKSEELAISLELRGQLFRGPWRSSNNAKHSRKSHHEDATIRTSAELRGWEMEHYLN